MFGSKILVKGQEFGRFLPLATCAFDIAVLVAEAAHQVCQQACIVDQSFGRRLDMRRGVRIFLNNVVQFVQRRADLFCTNALFAGRDGDLLNKSLGTFNFRDEFFKFFPAACEACIVRPANSLISAAAC